MHQKTVTLKSCQKIYETTTNHNGNRTFFIRTAFAEQKHVAITQEKVDKKKISFPSVAVKINGNFTGNGKNEFAIAKRIKIGQGNPVENGTPDEY